ncbi:c-type cytochrome [Massilia suwonensis]|uniref:C-type cytochrome n=1 Tax=Massilia suwonensis TaxID=648895 RepID=A0ABW0MM62_9BURK
MKTIALFLLACAPFGAGAADLANGQRLFALRCASCHAVGPSARAGFGPQLNALNGRRAGSTPDFRYSPAMAKSGIVWNDKTLAAFLDSPGGLVPGTKMRFWGMSDAKQVGDLLAYLRSIPAAPAR